MSAHPRTLSPIPLQVSSPEAKSPVSKKLARPASLRQVGSLLIELQGLLDHYGPVWYSEEHCDRITASLEFLTRIEQEQQGLSLSRAR